jgi:hypothetical protein
MAVPYNSYSKPKVRVLAFEYLIANISKWYCEAFSSDSKPLSPSEFNERNNISIRQTMLLPFFACSANGSFNDMFDLLGEFYALHDGPVSQTLLVSASRDEMQFFNIDVKEPDESIKVKVNYIAKDWDQILYEILDSNISMDEGGLSNEKFSEISFIDSPQKLIYKSIASSIKAIKEQSSNEFITYSEYDMISIARQYRSWSIPYEYHNSKDNLKKNIRDLMIDKELAMNDRKIYKPIDD